MGGGERSVRLRRRAWANGSTAVGNSRKDLHSHAVCDGLSVACEDRLYDPLCFLLFTRGERRFSHPHSEALHLNAERVKFVATPRKSGSVAHF